MEKATIFDIQHSSFVDGPGIRTTVFFKGCNLACKWCHNPESWSPKPELMFYEDRCIWCGICERVCPFSLNDCNLCGKCAHYCPREARKLSGKTYTVDAVFDEIISDKKFYENSGGGVTFSGGECMLQIDFLTEILKRCKEAGVHTAVDTAGNVPWESFESVLPYTDLFLYDVKAATDEIHKQYTGVSNKLILENLARLSGRAEIFIRIPIIPTVNDSEEELRKMARILEDIKVSKIELLPYHSMGEMKFKALGKSYRSFPTPTPEEMEDHRKVFGL